MPADGLRPQALMFAVVYASHLVTCVLKPRLEHISIFSSVYDLNKQEGSLKFSLKIIVMWLDRKEIATYTTVTFKTLVNSP